MTHGAMLGPWLLAVAAALAGDGPQEGETYGNAPRGMEAFSRVGRAYRQLFRDILEYHGPGREAPEPELAEVPLGLIATLEGRGSEYGIAMRDGILLALEEANDEGGIEGRPLRLLERNDQGPWGASSNEMVRLAYEDGAYLVFGSTEASSIHIALRVALKAQVPMMCTGCSDPTVTETGIPWIVRLFPDDRQNSYRLADQIFEQDGHQRVAIVRVNDKYGRMGIGEFMEASRRLGKAPPLEIRFAPGEEDFHLPIERVVASKATAVCFWGYAEEGGRFLRQLREAGVELPFYGCDLLVSGRLLELAGSAAEGAVLVSPWNFRREDPALEAFRQRFRERFGSAADVFATYGYDGARLAVDAIRRAGLNRPRIRDALFEVERFEGLTGSVELDSTRNAVGRVFLTRVEGGGFCDVW